MLTCRNVSMSYDGRAAVENVSFELARGDYLCVVGENGSGKTTLMKGILGLLPLSSGNIEFHGVKRTEIGYLPQQTFVQRDFPASVREVVLSGRLNRHGLLPFYTRGDRACANDNMERLGLASEAKKSYRDLSGGQQQRVLLARALCAARRLLVLDEPAAGLDPVAAREFHRLISKINRETGVTVVMVSHDMPCVLQYASHILYLKNVQAFFGTKEEYAASCAGTAFAKPAYEAAAGTALAEPVYAINQKGGCI